MNEKRVTSFSKRSVHGIWSPDLFADAAVAEEPAQLVFVVGMAAEPRAAWSPRSR